MTGETEYTRHRNPTSLSVSQSCAPQLWGPVAIDQRFSLDLRPTYCSNFLIRRQIFLFASNLKVTSVELPAMKIELSISRL